MQKSMGYYLILQKAQKDSRIPMYLASSMINEVAQLYWQSHLSIILSD